MIEQNKKFGVGFAFCFASVLLLGPVFVDAVSTASDYINNNAPSDAIGRDARNVLLMDITLYNPQGGAANTATIDSITVSNRGTAINNDLTNWQIWLDSGAAGFQGAGTDLSMAVTLAGTGPWTLTPTQNNIFSQNQRRIFITADIFTGADDKRTIQLQADINGFQITDADGAGAGAGSGPTDTPILNNGTLTIVVNPQAAIDTTPPSPVSNVKVGPTGNPGEIKLTWTNPTDEDFQGVRIWRSVAEGERGAVIVLNTAAASYLDSNLKDETTYYYTLEARDVSGNSAFTAQFSAKAGSEAAPGGSELPEPKPTEEKGFSVSGPTQQEQLQGQIRSLMLQVIVLMQKLIELLTAKF